MFIREKKNNSGSISIQIIEKKKGIDEMNEVHQKVIIRCLDNKIGEYK